jgi:hypothetical protein
VTVHRDETIRNHAAFIWSVADLVRPRAVPSGRRERAEGAQDVFEGRFKQLVCRLAGGLAA